MPTQRLRLQTDTTADGSGNAEFIFDSVPQGLAWTGTVGVVAAPATSLFSAEIGSSQVGLSWGEWGGNATFGPIQAISRETVLLRGTGLTPGTTYLATWIGLSEDEAFAAPVYPTALATVVSSTPTVTVPVELAYAQVIVAQAGMGPAATDLTGVTISPVVATLGVEVEMWVRFVKDATPSYVEAKLMNGAGSLEYTGATFTMPANGVGFIYLKQRLILGAGGTTFKGQLACGAGTVDTLATATSPIWIRCTEFAT